MNSTTGDDASLAVIITEAAVICIISPLIVIGNMLNIAVLRRNKILPVGSRFFMISLATADLGVGLLFFTTLVGCVTRKPLIDLVFPTCFALGVLAHVCSTASTVSLMFIAMDRYVAIQWPLHYASMVTKTRVVAVAVVQWVALMLYALSIGFILGRDFYGYGPATFQCIPHYGYMEYLSASIVGSVLFLLIPFAVIIFVYTRILAISRNQLRRIRQCGTTANEQTAGKSNNKPYSLSYKNMKAAKVCLAITAAFFIAWIPYGAEIFYFIGSGGDLPDWIEFVISSLLISNSFWNFIIYSAMNRSFRVAALVLVKKSLCFNSEQLRAENLNISREGTAVRSAWAE